MCSFCPRGCLWLPRGRRDGVVTARMEGRALDDAARRKIGAPEGSVDGHGLGGVVRAGRIKSAAVRRPEDRGEHGRGRGLIDPDQADRRGCCDPGATRGKRVRGGVHAPEGAAEAEIRLHASVKARSSWTKGHWFTWDRATRSRSHDAGSRSWRLRKISRILRFARFRRIALPTACVDATKQARLWAGSGERASHHKVKALQSTRRPCWRTSRMSLWRRRCCPGRKRMGTAIPRIKRLSAAYGPSCGGRLALFGRRAWTCGLGIRSCGLVSCDAGGRWVAWYRDV